MDRKSERGEEARRREAKADSRAGHGRGERASLDASVGLVMEFLGEVDTRPLPLGASAREGSKAGAGEGESSRGFRVAGSPLASPGMTLVGKKPLR